MTIQLYLNSYTMIEDLAVLVQLFDAKEPELGMLSNLKNISSTPYRLNNQIINVTMEEYRLICIFCGGQILKL